MKANSIEELFGSLLESVTISHEQHLATSKYSAHKCLNDFYDDFPEVIDALVEDYQGVYGKVGEMKNVVEGDADPIKYFTELRELAESGKDLIKEEDTELRSDLDAVLSSIDSVLYQLKELKENQNSLYENMGNLKSLSQYLAEKCCKNCKEDEKKIKNCPLCEEDVTDEKSFREYAMQVLKEMHKDDFDEKLAKETIDGILKDHSDAVEEGDWGKLIGILNKGTKA